MLAALSLAPPLRMHGGGAGARRGSLRILLPIYIFVSGYSLQIAHFAEA